MDTFKGFSRKTIYTPVPNPLFGELLQDIESLSELKCTLRAFALIHQNRSKRQWITVEELMDDMVLINGLSHEYTNPSKAIQKSVLRGVQRGTFIIANDKFRDDSQTLLFINDEPGRRAITRIGTAITLRDPEPVVPSGPRRYQTSIFSLYEDNIGPITPLIADELKEAEATHPWAWIDNAFREAVSHNHRNWRYISKILDRWSTKGKDDGEPGGNSKKTDPREYLRRYGRFIR
jgi:DNA replication protein